jgi:hypothetical protein
MLILSSIIACLSLVGAAVLALHGYQLRQASNSAERAAPLTQYGTDLDQPLEFDGALSSIAPDDMQIDELSLRFFKPLAIESIFAASAPNPSSESRPEAIATSTRQSVKDTPHYPLLGRTITAV